MRNLLALSAILFISGIAIIIISALSGNGGFALVLIFPVFYTSGPLGALGMLMILAGIFLFFLAPFAGTEMHPPSTPPPEPHHTTEKKKVNYGGVILIGPIPIVFGSDREHTMYAVIAAIILLMAIAGIILFMGI
ncbi:MAG: DUF131 domain-containing protein [Euryarchaeota archaeon]|nr:DUF131 domain-containing protein [Euryarchaeota archaeon]